MQKFYLKKSLHFLLVVITFLSLLIVGCDKAKETVKDVKKTVENDVDKASDLATETKEKAGEIVKETTGELEKTKDNVVKEAESIVEDKFLVGTWTGKFDSRKAVLVITEQNDNNIVGRITISYRQPINQDIKGTYNPETNKLQMADQLHSRYKGKYSSQLDDNKKTMSGTFTTLVDKKTVSFSLVKK